MTRFEEIAIIVALDQAYAQPPQRFRYVDKGFTVSQCAWLGLDQEGDQARRGQPVRCAPPDEVNADYLPNQFAQAPVATTVETHQVDARHPADIL
jgi:hypothetical protein